MQNPTGDDASTTTIEAKTKDPLPVVLVELNPRNPSGSTLQVIPYFLLLTQIGALKKSGGRPAKTDNTNKHHRDYWH